MNRLNIKQEVRINMPTLKRWRVWKEIEIGGKDGSQLIAELKKTSCAVGWFANMLMTSKKFLPLSRPTRIKLVKTTLRELGFSEGFPSTRQVWDRARQLRLQVCPAEVGPQLRLQYTEQPVGEYLFIAMEQINGPKDNPIIFGLGCGIGNALWLGGNYADKGDGWALDIPFIFSLPK